MNCKVQVHEILNIPVKYSKETSHKDRIVSLVHKNWLSNLLRNGKIPSFLLHENLTEDEIEAYLKLGENFGQNWQLISIKVLTLHTNKRVIPLPRSHPFTNTQNLTYSQVLHYVSHTNYKNQWKEAYKKYSTTEGKEAGNISLNNWDSVLIDIISRTYGCPIIYLSSNKQYHNTNIETHSNCLSAYGVIYSTNYLFILQPYIQYTLYDCLSYSPAILNSSKLKPLFIIYQLLQLMKDTHDRGLILGDIHLNDILINNQLWIQVLPKLEDNLYVTQSSHYKRTSSIKSHKSDTSRISHSEARNITNKCLEDGSTHQSGLIQLLDLWIKGSISNLDYLTALNCLSGRRYGSPNHHHVLPWVTDFSLPNGGWRDLTKSKFRLNKGDRQLDLTYDVANTNNESSNTWPSPAQTPHHVTDVLSEITYYVYMARRTSKSLLCKYVRPKWVPAEYPSSIQRMQEWTPDECIPEFYTDPTIFKSIHEDLSDLETPSWASSPEQFIEKHREALESNYVSERLNHWIDLTFGYKLSGIPAIKSKNVCLYLTDQHTHLTDTGVIQLFTQPHPHKFISTPYTGKIAPKTIIHPAITCKRLNEKLNITSPSTSTAIINEKDTEITTETTIEEEPKPLGLTKLLSKSRSSLLTEERITIQLPKDYNPISTLNDVENLYNFSYQTFYEGPQQTKTTIINNETTYRQTVASKRIKEMQILGCLLVELFLSNKIKVYNDTFDNRLNKILIIIKREWNDIPFSIREILKLLLQLDKNTTIIKYPTITQYGLPPPSAHQLLQPLLAITSLPFPNYFEKLYLLLLSINNLDKNEDDDKKIEIFNKELPELLPLLDNDGIKLILPYIINLLNGKCGTNAAWYLFDPVSKVLGPEETCNILLKPILQLYENGNRAKLYHRSFLLKIIIRLGLKIFLNNFITALVEAVGGYRDTTHAHEQQQPIQRKSSSVGNLSTDGGGILSPIDDSSVDSEKLPTIQNVDGNETDTEVEPEVFVFEDDDDTQKVLSPAVALDLMAQLELDMNETEGTSPLPTDTAESFNIPDLPQNTSCNKQEWRSSPRKPIIECPVSEMSCDSILWLAHRLGPVLTSKHLSRNLLRMLSLCYMGEENLIPSHSQDNSCCNAIPSLRIIGDDNAIRVINCLTSIAGLYGEQLILLQYFPHIRELIALCKRKLTRNLEGGLIGCLSLLRHIIPYLSDASLMEHLNDILKNILHPSVRLVASTRAPFPSSVQARSALAFKILESLYIISIRIGKEMTLEHLSSTLQRYFLAFDKADDKKIITINSSSADSYSPPMTQGQGQDEIRNKAIEELKCVFTKELANYSYLPFLRFLGETNLEQFLKNEKSIKELCYSNNKNNDCFHETITTPLEDNIEDTYIDDRITSSSFGTNVALIGNRIELQNKITTKPLICHSPICKSLPTDITDIPIKNKMENTNNRHLRGNWLAYWEHENGRADKDNRFNFKQIKLQQFIGHTNSVRALYVLDNENSFMSCSRDKTVKLWSLQSQGDGNATSSCQWTYTNHRKSVLSISFLESMRLVASCDSVVHLWDPFMGEVISQLDGANKQTIAPVNVLKALPPPSCCLLAATTESTLKLIDARLCSYVLELKVAPVPSGLIRCISVSPSGNWVAIGQSSGHLSILDIRTGLILSSWKAHEGEILQLVTLNQSTIISSSLDQSVAVWNIDIGNLKFHLKGPTEPVHCLNLYNNNELISATTANRIGVHTSINDRSSYSSNRLRSDTFRGVLTAMSTLSLNRLLLLGSDSGNISLLC